MRRYFRGVGLKNLNKSGKFRSGNDRYYYRPKGRKGIPLPDLPPDHPDFLRAYAAATEASDTLPKIETWTTGTIGAATRAYEQSDHFLGLASSTRARWRNFIDEIRTKYGKGSLVTLRAKHIRISLKDYPPHPANNRLKVWKAMGKFWVASGLLDEDPARFVDKRATPKTEGFEPWSREDVAAFRAYWDHTTPQRLAMELMHRTCASIGDACKLGPRMVQNGYLTYRRKKSQSMSVVPMSGGPAWFEPDHHLEECLKHAPRHLTYMTTRNGAPRSSKAAGQWFAEACRKAGFDKSAHGIRKHRASVFRENGASKDQRMAILGHETAQQADEYSKAADLRLVIESSNQGSNFLKKSGKTGL